MFWLGFDSISRLLVRGSQAVRSFELFFEGTGVQIFPNVGKFLLQPEQGVGDRFLVGEGNVAPHRIRTGRNASHFPQGSTAAFKQRRSLAVYFD